MRVTILLLILVLLSQSCSQSDISPESSSKEITTEELSIKAPVYEIGANGKTTIPGWQQVDSDKGLLFMPVGFTKEYDPHMYQITTTSNEGQFKTYDDFLKFVTDKTPLKNIKRHEGLKVEAFYQVFGVMVVASFGEAEIDGVKMSLFMDVYGPDTDGKLTGILIYARSEIFAAWDGVLFPLVLNGYVEDPSIFTNKEVMQITDYNIATDFYVAMINTKVSSEYATLVSLSESALQAMRNASVITSCASSDNCYITYDGDGNAVPNYRN